MLDTAQNITLTEGDGMEDKYLTFLVQDGEYGIEIQFVTEIIGVQDITPVPHTHHYVKGIINLRGTIVPVIDMRLRFSQEEAEYTDRTCIIVLSMEDMSIGLIVDEVVEVLDIDDEHIQPPPSGNSGRQNHFIKAIGTARGSVKQLLDIDRVFEVGGEGPSAP